MTDQTKDLLAIAETLERHNAWRRGESDIPMANPTEIGKAIDGAIEF